MATFIGYKYFDKMAQAKQPFSINGIDNNSTIDDIN